MRYLMMIFTFSLPKKKVSQMILSSINHDDFSNLRFEKLKREMMKIYDYLLEIIFINKKMNFLIID